LININENDKCSLAIFSSGTGSNFINIYNRITNGDIFAEVSLLISNNPKCKAVEFAKQNRINYKIINRFKFSENCLDREMLKALESHNIDLIVLAGYMKKIPDNIIKVYCNRILNIHPALLPKFGGKGFYGIKVHRAVIESGDKSTGVTIHIVDNNYDTGNIIYQEKIDVMKNDSPESLAKRVLKLEHIVYPEIIKEFCAMHKKELK